MMTHRLANSGFCHIPMPVTRMLTSMTPTEIGSALTGKLSNRIRKRLASRSVIKLSLTIEPDRIAPVTCPPEIDPAWFFGSCFGSSEEQVNGQETPHGRADHREASNRGG